MALYNQGLSCEFLLPLFEVLRVSLLLASGSKDLGSRDRGDGEPSQVSLLQSGNSFCFRSDQKGKIKPNKMCRASSVAHQPGPARFR